MRTPLDIHFEGLPQSDFIEARVREEVDRLEHFFDKIISCKVIIEKPHKHHHKGNQYEVRIFMGLPGDKIVSVDKNPGRNETHEDVYVAIRDSFNAAERQLKNIVNKMHRKVKTHKTYGEDFNG